MQLEVRVFLRFEKVNKKQFVIFRRSVELFEITVSKWEENEWKQRLFA